MCKIAFVGRHRRYNTAINIRLVYEPINNDSYYSAWSVAETKWSVSRRRERTRFKQFYSRYGVRRTVDVFTGSFKTVRPISNVRMSLVFDVVRRSSNKRGILEMYSMVFIYVLCDYFPGSHERFRVEFIPSGCSAPR